MTNIQTMAYQMPEFGLMALAMMIAVLTGGINLAIVTGSTVAAIIAGMFMTSSFAQENPVLGTIIGVIMIIGIAAVTA